MFVPVANSCNVRFREHVGKDAGANEVANCCCVAHGNRLLNGPTLTTVEIDAILAMEERRKIGLWNGGGAQRLMHRPLFRSDLWSLHSCDCDNHAASW